MYNNQFGFRKNKSAAVTLIKLVAYSSVWLKALVTFIISLNVWISFCLLGFLCYLQWPCTFKQRKILILTWALTWFFLRFNFKMFQKRLLSFPHRACEPLPFPILLWFLSSFWIDWSWFSKCASIECSRHVIAVRISLEANGVKCNVDFEIILAMYNRPT